MLAAPPGLYSMRAAKLDGALDRFRSGGEQKNFLEWFGQKLREPFHKLGSDLTRESVIRQQVRRGLVRDRIGDLLTAVTRIRDQHSGRPIDPSIAVGIEHLETLGAVP